MKGGERRITFILPQDVVDGVLELPVGYRRAVLASLLRLFLRLEAERGLPAAMDILDDNRWELREIDEDAA